MTANDSASGLQAQLERARESLRLGPPIVDGKLIKLVGLTLEADGCQAALADRCRISLGNDGSVDAEVVGFNGARTLLMPTGPVDGLRAGAQVRRAGSAFCAPVGDELLGRVIDGSGQPIDDRGPLRVRGRRAIAGRFENPLARDSISEVFDVGVRSINGLLSLGRGQRIGLFAGSGVGKSSLLGMMTRHSEAEVTVIALIGERGREINDFVHETLGAEGMRTAVVVAVPADQPPLARLQGAMLATTIAESFRDAGRHVLLLVDSLTRFAQAQREIGLAIGEPPATKGYPPSVFSRLPKLVERAGNFKHRGSITAIYTVLAEGDDQNDPVVDAARAVLDGHIVMSRELSEAGHFPAIDVTASVSRTANAVTTQAHQTSARRLLKLVSLYRANEDMLKVGLYKPGSDSELDRAIHLWPAIERFLQQRSEQGVSFAESQVQLEVLLSEPPAAGRDTPDEALIAP